MRSVFAFALAALFLTACAQDVGDIDRTQPGKLRKSVLEGEWHYRQTVVDVPFTTGVTFIGEQSLLERIRWEISEEFLTAYRSYERVQGSEAPSTPGGETYQGAPVAAFRVTSHFDVQRQYNPATGEQSNVIVENTTDRPWYEREFFRVDWSHNLVANFDFLAGGEGGLGVLAQPSSYAVTDPAHPDAPVFAVNWDDVGWEDYRDPREWGELEFLDYFDVTQKLQVTPDSFLVEFDDGTYEEWPSCWFYEYGPWDCTSQTIEVRASFLRVEESSYDPLYYPDNYIARDDNGDAIGLRYNETLGDYEQCGVSDGPDCELVRVPMFDWFGYFRTERETYDRDYGVTEEGRIYLANLHNMWDVDLNPAPIVYYLSPEFPADLLPAAQEIAEAWSGPLTVAIEEGWGETAPGPMFEVRPNTYRAENGVIVDHGQRNGDLRYNHLYWVDDPQFEALLGYGPAAADPLTGEVISATAYVYGAAIDEWVAQAADVIDLMRGRIDEREFIGGENVGPAVASLGREPSYDPAGMRRRVQRQMDQGLAGRLEEIRKGPRDRFNRRHDYASARLRLADGDPRFDSLWNDEMERTMERRFGRKLEPSEVRGGRLLRALRRHRQKLGAHAVDLRQFEDASVLGLVREMGTLSREDMMARLRAYFFKSVGLHEVGHTLGLRHNFGASTDALNFHDEYWDIRDANATALQLPSRTEMESGLREYGYSSIMDYPARFSGDVRGLGRYDAAAVKFAYGGLVEVFDSPPDWQTHDVLAYFNLDEAVADWVHYTDLPALFDGRANMRARSHVPIEDVIGFLVWDAAAPDLTDTIVPYRFCSDEYAGAVWWCDMFDEGADPYEIVSYASQEWRDYYIFRAFKRHRRYVDPIEYYYGTYFRTMVPLSTQYQHWIFDQWYKADLWEWLSSDAPDFITDPNWNLDPKGGLAHTAASMQALNFLAEVIVTPENGSYYTDPDTGLITWWTPEEDVICGPGQNSAVDACSDLYVPVGTGRYSLSEFDAESGYYWYERIRVVGSFWDKLAAVETLADPTSYFLGVDDVADYTTYILGFNVAFPHAVETLFGAMVNDDYPKFAPQLEADGTMSVLPIFEDVVAAYGDTPAPDRPGPFVDPATNWTVSLYALFYGMALLNANFDNSFNDSAKIWLEGSGEAFTPDASAVVATFTNPYNGRIYHGIQSPDPLTYSMGYEMVSRAERLANDPVDGLVATNCLYRNAPECVWPRWELQNLVENIEVVRGYYDLFGYSWF